MDVVELIKKRAVHVVEKAGEGAAGACGAAWGSPVAYQALQDRQGGAGPPSGAPTDFGKRGTLPQKEAGSPLEASLPGVAGLLGMGEVGVCRGLNCWLHYLRKPQPV